MCEKIIININSLVKYQIVVDAQSSENAAKQIEEVLIRVLKAAESELIESPEDHS